MVKTVKSPQTETSSASIIVLQWLTYAFWGWLILGLIWLMSVILINAVLDESVNEVVPYAIAASVVLLPLAFVCDLFYRKYEPVKKAGGAMVIMVIHAVLFAVLGIISLIVAVFTGLNAAINITGDVDGQMVVVTTAAFATVLYAAAFLRTLNPFNGKKVSFIYSISMLALTVLLLVLAIVGPVVQSVATRGDRLIEQHLPEVQTAINDYIADNNKLPASLKDISVKSQGAKDLIADNTVELINEGTAKTNETGREQTVHRYQLCVDYQKSSNESSWYQNDRRYTPYLETYSHGEGRQCYKLQNDPYIN